MGKKDNILCRALIVTGVAIFVCLASGCKGRTMDNVEPTGETIEVVIMQPADTINIE